MPHEELVELTDKYFSSLKTPAASPADKLSSQSPSVYKSLTRAASSYLTLSSAVDGTHPELARAPIEKTYTGGHRFMYDPDSEFNHLYLGFEGVGIHDADIYTLATMQVLLGGGGSFSAGEYIHLEPLTSMLEL
jgi:processing peptidase subunit alpha